jgi:hypothetical protein
MTDPKSKAQRWLDRLDKRDNHPHDPIPYDCVDCTCAHALAHDVVVYRWRDADGEYTDFFPPDAPGPACGTRWTGERVVGTVSSDRPSDDELQLVHAYLDGVVRQPSADLIAMIALVIRAWNATPPLCVSCLRRRFAVLDPLPHDRGHRPLPPLRGRRRDRAGGVARRRSELEAVVKKGEPQ